MRNFVHFRANRGLCLLPVQVILCCCCCPSRQHSTYTLVCQRALNCIQFAHRRHRTQTHTHIQPDNHILSVWANLCGVDGNFSLAFSLFPWKAHTHTQTHRRARSASGARGVNSWALSFQKEPHNSGQNLINLIVGNRIHCVCVFVCDGTVYTSKHFRISGKTARRAHKRANSVHRMNGTNRLEKP